MQPTPKGLLIACKVLKEQIEMLGELPYEAIYLEQGLHRTPKMLTEEIQKIIHENQHHDLIILGYGLCSRAVIGLRGQPHQTMVIPRIDDCIGLSLGERAKYFEQFKLYPGTYYFTKGWTEVGEDPLKEYKRTVEKYDEETAEWTIRSQLANYVRTVYIKTSEGDDREAVDYVKGFADFFNLQYEEMTGSLDYLQKLIFGPWDEDFIVVKGVALTDEMFASDSE
ncbi:MAG: DUF1638 domain-containing protein [Desulfitobacterium sp.]|nr:DUF1638 domain-containing protein [Desulfitobacterium sp.]